MPEPREQAADDDRVGIHAAREQVRANSAALALESQHGKDMNSEGKTATGSHELAVM
jgi:hypothetical protein